LIKKKLKDQLKRLSLFFEINILLEVLFIALFTKPPITFSAASMLVSYPNTVKVIVDQNNYALYFSRSPIPFPRDKDAGARYFKHKGIYAFRKQSLLDFSTLPMQFLEATEKIECIRYLEYGKRIKMVETTIQGVEIDTPEDLEKAKRLWK
jgi:3-deoxy-manno-octulosonate cytidylyltransferase (CMP-KDO synthetase)